MASKKVFGWRSRDRSPQPSAEVKRFRKTPVFARLKLNPRLTQKDCRGAEYFGLVNEG